MHYRKDDPNTDGFKSPPQMSAAEQRAAIDRFEERADKVRRIKAVDPDFDPFGRDDTYLNVRLRLINARDAAQPELAEAAESAKRGLAGHSPRPAGLGNDLAVMAGAPEREAALKARDAALDAIINMHKGEPSSHTATHDEDDQPKNDAASIIADMSRPVDRTRVTTADNDESDTPRTPSFAEIIADMSRPQER